MNKEFAKAGVKKSVAPASEMANKPSGMSNRTKFRLTCTVLNVIAIAATLAIVKPKMFIKKSGFTNVEYISKRR